MDDKTTNRADMIRTAIKFCEDNSSATSGIKIFAPTLAIAKNKLTLVDGLNQITTATTKGVTLDANAIKQAMLNMAFSVGQAVFAYAAANNNQTLKKMVDYSESDFKRLKKEDADDICETIHNEAKKVETPIADYGITPSAISDLKTSIDLFRTASTNPRQAIINKSKADRQAKEIIRELIQNIFKDQLDKMANTLKEKNADFHKGYFAARNIIARGKNNPKEETNNPA